MKRFIILLALMGVMLAVSPSTAMASHTGEGTVAATVTPAVVSVSTTPNVDYGSVHLSGTDLIPTPDHFTAENTGNVDVDFLIKGGDSTLGATKWTIEASTGLDQFVHRASIDAAFTVPIVLDDGSNLSLGVTGENVTPSSTLDVYLQLDAPTSTTVDDQQSLPVTIVATAS